MCREKQYETPELFWATFWHEMIHATGSASRLKRPSGVPYSQDPITLTEELIAAHGSILRFS